MREIKFRAWWKDAEIMEDVISFSEGEVSILVPLKPNSLGQKYERQTLDEGEYEIMQFTGLKDKTGVVEVYEGDIIDSEGNIKGNIYESPQIYEKGVDCLIEGMGTKTWRDTESVAMGRGCKYAE